LVSLNVISDSHGDTPFMSAVSNRAYPAALALFSAVKRVAADSSDDAATRAATLRSMTFPAGSPADRSPLHVLCCNDTCSFTWTGAEHINQDIFECRTCGLTDSLCCCTECARVCHAGHDCKLKRTSPTAYCDCWEKCRCKALVAGNQQARMEVLHRLVAQTDLVTRSNGRGENVLLFLVQTVGRQVVEQRQWRPSRARKGARKTEAVAADPDMPEHDLDPPRFARKALEKLLGDWTAVGSMIAAGDDKERGEAINEDQAFLGGQSGTALLDKFTHCLLVKCSAEMLDALLTTLIRQLQTTSGDSATFGEAKRVARRFVRSVARLFVIFSVEAAPGQGRKKSLQSSAQPLQRCKRVFQALVDVAVEELCETANALLAPVRYGVARPSAAFAAISTSSTAEMMAIEELFSSEPMTPAAEGGQGGKDSRGGGRGDQAGNGQGQRRSRNNSIGEQSSLLRGRRGGTRGQSGVGQPAVTGINPLASMNSTASTVHLNESLEQEMDDDSREAVANEGVVDDFAEEQQAAASNEANEAEGSGDQGQQQGGGERGDQDDQHSDMDLDLLAESESDSDGENDQQGQNQQDQQGQGAGQGGEGAVFSEEDSDGGGGDSSHGEDDDEEESDGDGGETADEHDEEEEDEFAFAADDQLERRAAPPSGIVNAAASASNDRANLAPQHMQWALRPRPKPRGIAAAAGGASSSPAAAAENAGGGFITIAPPTLRRPAAGGPAAAAAVAAAAAASGAAVTAESATVATTASALSRGYGIVVRQIADLLTGLQDYSCAAPSLPRQLVVNADEFHSLLAHVERKLLPNWTWLMTVMDSTEAQLRFGSALSNASDPNHPQHPLHAQNRGGGSAGGGGRGERPAFQSR